MVLFWQTEKKKKVARSEQGGRHESQREWFLSVNVFLSLPIIHNIAVAVVVFNWSCKEILKNNEDERKKKSAALRGAQEQTKVLEEKKKLRSAETQRKWWE